MAKSVVLERKSVMKDRITVILFLGFIFIIMAVTMVMPDREFSSRENRYLNRSPKITLEKVLNGKFEEEYKDYMNDQFLCRDECLRISSEARYFIGMRDINGVYIGKDGYLIEKHDRLDFESDTAWDNIGYLSEFTKSLEDRAVNYHVIMIPTASEILTGKLPVFALPYGQKAFIDKVYDEVGKEHTVDALLALSRHADEYIYYKTDHHYTSLGAYYVYEKWAEQADVTIRDREEFHVNKVTSEFYGTLDAKTHLAEQGDEIYLYTLKNQAQYEIRYNESENIVTDMYDIEALEKRDKYSVFLGGNHSILEIRTKCDNNRKLLVIKDSFAHSFIPFIINDFEQTDVIDLRYYNKSVKGLIDEKGYTDVLILYSTSNFATDNCIFKIVR